MSEVHPVGFGPATPESLRLDREAEAILERSLETTRAATREWAKTIAALTGLLGIIALVKGREDVTDLVLPARVLVGLFLLAGLVFAIRAIMLAALASEGTPKKWWVIGQRLKDRYRSERRLAAAQLLESRSNAVAAVALLIVSVGIAWYAPEAEPNAAPPMVLVTFTDRAPLCGELAAGDRSLVARQGDLTVSVAGGNVRTLNVVAECPEGKDGGG